PVNHIHSGGRSTAGPIRADIFPDQFVISGDLENAAIRACMGLFLSSRVFGLLAVPCSEQESRVLRPVACDQVRGTRGRGQGTETVAELAAWRLAGLVFRSALTPEHAQRR